MPSVALHFTFLLCAARAAAVEDSPAECSSPAGKDREECASLNLMQTQLELRRKESELESKSESGESDCKTWCETKVEKGKSTWDVLCTYTNCAACSACPTTTTTSTTTIYNPYCSGVDSLMQKRIKISSAKSGDRAKKIEKENQAMKYHHSYCGRSHLVAHNKQKTFQAHAGLDKQKTSHARAGPDNIKRGDCEAYTSTRSPSGLATCDADKNMPYAYAYHLHPTYDADSADAAKLLKKAFEANFGVTDCEHVDEQTTYSTKERICMLSNAKACSKDAPESPGDVEAIFPLCQFGIYVRGGAMFDDSMGADGTSPWQWMSLNKDCFGADIDVLAHAVLCPALAHGQWAFFVNGTHETTAATWITGDNSVDGCYGQECQPAECEVAEDVLNGSAVYENTCCAVTALESVPTELDDLMAKTYSNVLKFQTSTGWWDIQDEEVKDHGSYAAEFPSTVWPGGTCHGVCTDLE